MKRIFTLFLLMVIFSTFNMEAQVNISILNKPYKQNFDSLARTGTSTRLPYGWHIMQTNGRLNYRANAGDSSNANIFSYGTRTGFRSLNRALGSISSAADTVTFGADFVNNTGYAINTLTISYTVEQWHLGATNRGSDTTEFDYSTNANGLRDHAATWTRVSSLDLVSPVTSGTAGALNGGVAGPNQYAVSYKITGLSIAKGAHFWFRWYDHAISGANDGLAIDNFSLVPYSDVAGPTVVYKIRDARFPQTAGLPDTTQIGKFKVVVISPNFVSHGGLQFSVRDSTGAITAMAATSMGYTVNVGDSVYITGKIRSYKYLAYIALDSLTLLKANAAPSPAPIVAANITEQNESNLIQMNNLTISPNANWDTTGAWVKGGFVTTATVGLRTVSIFINKNSDLFLKKRPDFPFNLRGIALQSSTTPTGGYFIWPRSSYDIDTLPQPPISLYNIGQVNLYRKTPAFVYGLADSLNKRFFIKGIVHSADLSASGEYFSLIDNTGAISVYNLAPVYNYKPKIGDSILVRGTVLQVAGLIVIAADSVKLLNSGNSLMAPKPVTALNRDLESYLVTLKNVKITDFSMWDTLSAGNTNGFVVPVSDGVNTFNIIISRATDLYFKSPVKGRFNVTGIVSQSSANNFPGPYNDNFLLIPRGSFDIQPIKLPYYTISQVKGYNATTGVADSIGVGCYLKGVVESGNLNDSLNALFTIADNTNSISIVNIANAAQYTARIGDSVLIAGTINQVNGLTLMVPDTITTLSINNPVVSPVLVSTLDEEHESMLVKLMGYTIYNPNQWDNINPANKAGFDVTVYRGTDSVTVHISRTTDLYFVSDIDKPRGKVDITGVELQSTGIKSAPFANYYIAPRKIGDIVANTGIENTSITSGISIYPNPVMNKLQINSISIIDKVVLTDILGNRLIEDYAHSNNLMMDMAALKPGIYVLEIKSGNNTSIQKLVRQ